MGQALYRQYRPKSLAEVVGQKHITDTLLHALEQGKLAHAYLFTGPRGIGKTSIARILAHEINSLPYEDDSMHLDIIEIDAASNRRIDEIRDLRDKVHTAPANARYKVYIIDEVHMLTREAFNALLKTLEEPPAHAVFILATTESHKLPETIVSRTQRFTFRPVPLEEVVAHLRHIAEKEGIAISDEALELIAAHGEGSFRDSISLLDQTRGHDSSAGGEVDGDFVRTLIGVPTTEAIDALCAALEQADAPALVQSLAQLREQGFVASQVAKQLGQRLRADILSGQVRNKTPTPIHEDQTKTQAPTRESQAQKDSWARIFDLLEALLNIPTQHNPEGALELCLLSYALAGQSHQSPQPPAAAAPGTPPPTAPAPMPSSPSTESTATPEAVIPPSTPSPGASDGPDIANGVRDKSNEPDVKDSARAEPTDTKQSKFKIAPFRTHPAATATATASTSLAVTDQPARSTDNVQTRVLAQGLEQAEGTTASSTAPVEVDPQLWPEVLNTLKKTHNTLYGITRAAQPVFYKDAVELGFKFAFHKKRVGEPKNREIIAQAIKELSGKEMAIRCVLISKNSPQASATQTPTVSTTTASQDMSVRSSQPIPTPAITQPERPTSELSTISNIFGGAEVLEGSSYN